MKKIRRYSYAQIIAIALAVVLYSGLKLFPLSSHASAKNEFLHVARVVDGDTLKLSNGERIRLIGVDTPELHYSSKLLRDAKRTHKDIRVIQELGSEAKNFTSNLCLGKKVRLEFDVEKRDRYGRLLAYVYLEDGTFVNAKILEEGYGKTMTIPPNVKYAEYFLKLQEKARAGNKGSWSRY